MIAITQNPAIASGSFESFSHALRQ